MKRRPSRRPGDASTAGSVTSATTAISSARTWPSRKEKKESSTSSITTTARAAASAWKSAPGTSLSWRWREDEEDHGGESRGLLGSHAGPGGGDLGLSDYPPDLDRGGAFSPVCRWKAEGEVHPGGIRTLGHGLLHRGRGRGRPDVHGNFLPGAGADARDAPLGHGGAAAHCHGQRQPGPGFSFQHLGRAERQPGPEGYGVAADLLRKQPGGPGYGHPGFQDRRTGP